MKIIKTIDNELLWFFGYAESAVGIGSLTLLPTHESAALAAAPDEEGAIVARVCHRGLVLLERAFRGYVRERGGAGAKLLQGVS